MLARRGGQLLAEDTVEFGTIEEPLTGAALGVGVQVELPDPAQCQVDGQCVAVCVVEADDERRIEESEQHSRDVAAAAAFSQKYCQIIGSDITSGLDGHLHLIGAEHIGIRHAGLWIELETGPQRLVFGQKPRHGVCGPSRVNRLGIGAEVDGTGDPYSL